MTKNNDNDNAQNRYKILAEKEANGTIADDERMELKNIRKTLNDASVIASTSITPMI